MSPLSSSQHELLYHTFGRQSFRRTTANLDLFLRRFNQVQLWVVTEVCLCGQLSKRVQLLKKFIKIAAQWVGPAGRCRKLHLDEEFITYMLDFFTCIHLLCVFVRSCREFKNLNSFFAIIMGMSNPAVSRLSQTWEVNFVKYTSSEPCVYSTAAEVQQWNVLGFLSGRNFPPSLRSSMLSLKVWWWVAWNYIFISTVVEQNYIPTAALTLGIIPLVPEFKISQKWTLFIWSVTGPIEKPPVLPTHCHQTGTTNHPLHAPPSQRYNTCLS